MDEATTGNERRLDNGLTRGKEADGTERQESERSESRKRCNSVSLSGEEETADETCDRVMEWLLSTASAHRAHVWPMGCRKPPREAVGTDKWRYTAGDNNGTHQQPPGVGVMERVEELG